MNDGRPVQGFRPSTRRRNRIALGVVLGAVAVGGNVLLYSSLDDRDSVVQAVTDIPAGTLITPDMLRSVEVDVDATVQVVDADDLAAVAGSYAKVRIVSGSLVTSPALQSEPLVASGAAIVAITVDDGTLPAGLRERSPVRLVVPRPSAEGQPTLVDGRTVGLPAATDLAIGSQTLSVEVAAADATVIAAADDVRVVLLEPDVDPAIDSDDGGSEEDG